MRMSIHEYLNVPSKWPIVENVTHEIVLMPNAKDIRTGKRGDPLACALHNAGCRQFDIPNCAIGGRWAWIPQRDAKGKYYIARMQATAETQRSIHRFDATGKLPKGGFRFIPVAKSANLKRKAKYMQRYMKTHVRLKADEPRQRPHTKRQHTRRTLPHNVVSA